MHVSIAVTTTIIILFVVAAHAARTLTVQEAEVSETGSGQELRQLPSLNPEEEEEEEIDHPVSVLTSCSSSQSA